MCIIASIFLKYFLSLNFFVEFNRNREQLFTSLTYAIFQVITPLVQVPPILKTIEICHSNEYIHLLINCNQLINNVCWDILWFKCCSIMNLYQYNMILRWLLWPIDLLFSCTYSLTHMFRRILIQITETY